MYTLAGKYQHFGENIPPAFSTLDMEAICISGT
jgi:hypothetical protein